jgi:hypothetical protein
VWELLHCSPGLQSGQKQMPIKEFAILFAHMKHRVHDCGEAAQVFV